MKQVFLHGLLDRMKKNVLPDYPTDDIPNGFYFQMKNMLNHIVDRLPSGLPVTSRAERKALCHFWSQAQPLTMLREAVKTGVCHPHLLLLQTAPHPHDTGNDLRWVCVRANKCFVLACLCGHWPHTRSSGSLYGTVTF